MAPKKAPPPPRQGPVVVGEVVRKGPPGALKALSVDYLLLLLSRLTVVRVAGRLLSPLWRAVSLYLYLAGLLRRLALGGRRLALRFLGYLHGPCAGGFFRRLSVRWCLVRRWHVLALAVLGVSLVRRAIARWLASRSPVAREKRRLAERMATAGSYVEWSLAASALDDLQKATMPRALLADAVGAPRPGPLSSSRPKHSSGAGAPPPNALCAHRQRPRECYGAQLGGSQEFSPTVSPNFRLRCLSSCQSTLEFQNKGKSRP